MNNSLMSIEKELMFKFYSVKFISYINRMRRRNDRTESNTCKNV